MFFMPTMRDILFHIAIHAEAQRHEPDIMTDLFPPTNWLNSDGDIMSCPLSELKLYFESEGYEFQSFFHFANCLKKAASDLNQWRTVRVAFISGDSLYIDTHAEDCIP